MFKLESSFQPAGDQPRAINDIVNHFQNGGEHYVLLGVTGSGKTFSMANVIRELGKSTLVMAPNKTLAAQLYAELKGFFPHDPVGFFISYYDYYQPEAYIPATDTYIAKDSAINEDIDKMRHECTRSLFEESRAIVVASVSCIYGLGSPSAYASLMIDLKAGDKWNREELMRRLIEIQYSRGVTSFDRGQFRVRGSSIDIFPPHQKEEGIRLKLAGGKIATLEEFDLMTGMPTREIERVGLYPNSHYVADQTNLQEMIKQILEDLGERLRFLQNHGRLIEARRLEQRTMQDVETLEQLGFCPGIENYSRYLSGKQPGEPPACLLDYFPEDFLTIIDESHITVPQIRGMYHGDRARKQNLVHFGFRLPSALDNRPLDFDEFSARNKQVLYVSATPSEYDFEISQNKYTEQIIRPTGLVDPQVTVKPADDQVDDLYDEIQKSIAIGGRTMITVLTKKMAEELATYYRERGLAVRYLHSDIDALGRAELLRHFREGRFDALIGINLLREGLDLPEVVLVGIMDADKEGFLRSRSSLIQMIGRAARNSEARVIFYANRITDSMRQAMDETQRRRTIQIRYNREHDVTPRTVTKALPKDLRTLHGLIDTNPNLESELEELAGKFQSKAQVEKELKKLTKEMKRQAAKLEFEKAKEIQDQVKQLRALLLLYGEDDGQETR